MIKKLICGLLAVVISAGLLGGCQSKTEPSSGKTSTTKVTRGTLQVGLSADGKVALPVSYLDFSVDGKIKAIYVSAGDMVKEGDLLAELDDSDLQITLSNAKTSLNKAELAYDDAIASAEYNMKNELKNLESLELKLNTPFDDYTYQQSIKDAQTNLERKQKDLADAEKNIENGFDDYTYQQSIKDAQTNLERKQKDLADAEKNIENGFDDYTYQQSIKDAQTNLERKQKDLDEAIEALNEAENKEFTEFDEYTYQTNIASAQTTLDRRLADLENAEKALEDAKKKVYDPFDADYYQKAVETAQLNADRKQLEWENSYSSGSNETIQKAYDAWIDAVMAVETAVKNQETALGNYLKDVSEKRAAAVEAAQKTVDSATLSVEDAKTALNNAKTNLERAKNDNLSNQTDSKDSAVSAAETKVASAQNTVADAENSLQNAITNLERAKKSFDDSALEKVESAKTAVTDAENSLQNAITNLERARKSFDDSALEKVESAGTAVIDAENSLQNAKNNLTRARESYNADLKTTQNSYDLQVMKIENMKNSSTSILNAELEVENAKTKVAEAENNIEKTKLIAPMSGKILDIAYKVGETVTARASTPILNFGTGGSGVMTLCDVTEIFLSTSVTEGDIVGIYEGQTIRATVDALGEENVPASVYSVSSIPTTDSSGIVSYKVVGKLDDVNDDLKDGMNVFLTFIKREKENVLLIPVRSVFIENNKQYVNVETSEGVYEKREVVCGLSNGSQTEVLEGLNEGETVVVGSVR